MTEATYDAGGNITSFAASFVQYSDGSGAPLIGQVAYNSTEAQPVRVLANDSDPNIGTTLSAVEVSGPSEGTLALNPDGPSSTPRHPASSGRTVSPTRLTTAISTAAWPP